MPKETAFEILQRIEKFVAAEIKDISTIEYPKGDESVCFHVNTKNGQIFSIFVLEVFNEKKRIR